MSPALRAQSALEKSRAEALDELDAVASVLKVAEDGALSLASARDRAHAELDAARSAVANAKSAYAATPGDGSPKALDFAEKLRAADWNLRQAEARHEFATEKHDAAMRSVETAREAHDAATKRVAIAGHAIDASPETLHARIAAPAQRWLAALEAMRAAAEEIDAAVQSSNAAAAAHTAKGGGHLPMLDGGHVLLDVADAITDRGMVIDSHAWMHLRNLCDPASASISRNGRPIGYRFGGLVDFFSTLIEKGPGDPHLVAWAKARNSRARRTRTDYQATELDRVENPPLTAGELPRFSRPKSVTQNVLDAVIPEGLRR